MSDETDAANLLEWQELGERLKNNLQTLKDGEFVIVSVLRPTWPGPKRSGLRRLLGSGGATETEAYVQFLWFGYFLQAECAGSTSIGGPLELSPAQQDQLTELGWEPPFEPFEQLSNYIALFPDKATAFREPPSAPSAVFLDDAAAARAADLAVSTVRGPFGARGAGDVSVTRDR